MPIYISHRIAAHVYDRIRHFPFKRKLKLRRDIILCGNMQNRYINADSFFSVVHGQSVHMIYITNNTVCLTSDRFDSTRQRVAHLPVSGVIRMDSVGVHEYLMLAVYVCFARVVLITVYRINCHVGRNYE